MKNTQDDQYRQNAVNKKESGEDRAREEAKDQRLCRV